MGHEVGLIDDEAQSEHSGSVKDCAVTQCMSRNMDWMAGLLTSFSHFGTDSISRLVVDDNNVLVDALSFTHREFALPRCVVPVPLPSGVA